MKQKATAIESRPPVLAHLASVGPNRNLLPELEERVGSGTGLTALEDGLAFITYGAGAIAQDDFTKCFQPEPRTRFSLEILFAPFYMGGFLFRYCILFPYRLCLLLSASLIFFTILPIVNYSGNEEWQRWLFMFYCNAFLRAFGAQITYHGVKPKLRRPHVFVANHTSLIDYIVLSANVFPHAVIAQSHGGVLGFFLKSVLTLNGSLIFDRAAKNDRNYIPSKMKQHTRNVAHNPLLIFPEGTCVNNEYTVLFHKGAFELAATICPVAIKYNKKWADAYWFRTTQTFITHLLFLMTRWALVADVWYLAPEDQRKGESPVEFANRTKALISKQAKLKDLSWDGYFKHFGPPKEKQDRLKENPQTRYGAILLHRLRQPDGPTSDRLGRMRRSNSITLGEVPALRKVNAAPEWLLGGETTQKGNKILVAIEDQRRGTDMIHAIETRISDVIQVWKDYAKLRSATETKARIEYSSWRVWFKQRLEHERSQSEKESLFQELKSSSSEGWLDYLTEAASTATVALRRNLSSKSITDLMGAMTSTNSTMSNGNSSQISSNGTGHHRNSITALTQIPIQNGNIIEKSSDGEDSEFEGSSCSCSRRRSASNVHLPDEWTSDKPPIIAAN